MDQGDNRRPAEPARGQEGAGVDLVDHDVVLAHPLAGPEPLRLAVDAEPASGADDLHAFDPLTCRSSVHRRCEQGDLMATVDQRSSDLFRENLRTTGRRMREVLPVE